MLIKYSLLFFFCLLLLKGNAQHYRWGIGVRAGKFNTGLSYKNFFAPDNATAVEIDGFYTHIASGGISLKGLIVKQVRIKIPIVRVPLDFIFGAGLHVGYFPNKDGLYYKRQDKEAKYYSNSIISSGLDATLQIEYQIPKRIVPVTISIEAIPFYELLNPGPEYFDVGLCLRYVFR